MLRSFDLKQNVNSHAFKETFLPKSCKNGGKEEVINKSTRQQHQNTISFKTKAGGTSKLILPGLFHSHSTNKTCNAMEEEGKCQEANAKISIITAKNQRKNARLKRKLNGLKLASRSTKGEISHNQNLQILAPERLFLGLKCVPLTFKISPQSFSLCWHAPEIQVDNCIYLHAPSAIPKKKVCL